MPVTDGSLESSATPMTPYILRKAVEFMSRSSAKIRYRKAKAVSNRDDRLFAAIWINEYLSLHLTTNQVIDECALAGT